MSPEQDAEAFVLVREQGVSLRDCAKRMGETLARVRSAVTREAVRRGRPSFAERVGLTTTVNGDTLRDVASVPDAPTDDFLAALVQPLHSQSVQCPPDAADADSAAEDEEPALDADVETIIRYQIRRVTRAIRSLNARGADAEAQRYTRVLSAMAHELRQHDKAKRDADGVMTYTLDDVLKAETELDQMAADVAHRPFVCAECGRAMRRAEAEGKQ